MKLRKLEIRNFRRIEHAIVELQPATFLVGPNNTAKSSVIAAIEAILSLESEKLTIQDIRERPDGTRAPEAIITAHFDNLSGEVAASRGFKGRVINNEFVYRKTLSLEASKPKIETREYPSRIKASFEKAKKVKDLLAAGITENNIKEALGHVDPEKTLGKDWHKGFPEVLDFDTNAAASWVANPGGIPQNVLSRLPRLIHIPALTEAKEIESGEKKYPLGECLGILFDDLIHTTSLAGEIQGKLTELESEMNSQDDDSLVHQLVSGINKIIGEVFPKCGIEILPSLQNLLEILRPKYDISVFSNVRTGAARQGTGLIRTCIFAMLRYHAKLRLEKELQTREIFVAFEEPELFLHPSAANLLRDTVYTLGQSDQIICTTHSPWMIDLSKDPQSITRMSIGESDACVSSNYGVSSEFGKLSSRNRARVKMAQAFDDELSRVFFAKRVVIVEGDSEVLAIKQTLRLYPEEVRKNIAAHYQVVKARGKPIIIALIKYLRALSIKPIVIHDGDYGVKGAEKFNGPISDALGDADSLVVLDKCLENAMGYKPSRIEKPFKAYTRASSWTNIDEIPTAWRDAIEKVFRIGRTIN